jgi:hypothetical protein
VTDTGLAGHFWRKITYVGILLTLAFCYGTAWIYSLFKRRKKGVVKKIAAVWYWPTDFNADELRMGFWASYLSKEGILLENFWICSQEEFVRDWEKGIWSKKYLFYSRMIWRRWKQYFKMIEYDVVWIDRAFLPYFPIKRAFFERCIKRIGCRIVIDNTDGSDLVSNERLVLDTIAQADTLTVGYEKLYERYKSEVPKIVRLNWTIPVEPYIVKSDWELQDPPVLGWMGSPSNYRYLLDIVPELEKVAMVRSYKLIVICRLDVDIQIPNVEVEHHLYNDEYYNLIGEFDIGLAPFTERGFVNEGKIAMKHQEFLICKIPQVCSDVAISEHVRNEEHVLMVSQIDGWSSSILRLLEDQNLRKKLGVNSRVLFDKHYHYDAWYPTLKDALTNFSHLD